MASTDTTLLRASTEAFFVDIDRWSPRNFVLVDVDSTGADVDAPPDDEGTEQALDPAFGGMTNVGSISGSVDSGGMSGDFAIPDLVVPMPVYTQIDLRIRTWHGNVPGVIGAAGTDPGRVLFYRGYVSKVAAHGEWQKDTVRFTVESSMQFLSRSSFTRSIDFGPGLAHSGPITLHGAIGHLLDAHTNLKPRSVVGIYLPDHTFERLTLNQGSVMSMLKGLADNALEGWVFFDREDNLQIMAHPNLAPEAWAEKLADPIIEFDDTLIETIDIEEYPSDQVSQVTLNAMTYDGKELRVDRYGSSGLGERKSFSGLRYDDIDALNTLAALYEAHANRRYRVKIRTFLNIAADLGNIVTVSTEVKQRGISWIQKPFVVLGISYNVNMGELTFSSELTLDEVVV